MNLLGLLKTVVPWSPDHAINNKLVVVVVVVVVVGSIAHLKSSKIDCRVKQPDDGFI
jgi:hypothetical protein